MNKINVEGKIVGVLNVDNVLNYEEGSEVKDVWERCVVDASGTVGVIDDVMLFVGESEEQVRGMCVKFLRSEIDFHFNKS